MTSIFSPFRMLLFMDNIKKPHWEKKIAIGV